jgi:hypothetical protein
MIRKKARIFKSWIERYVLPRDSFNGIENGNEDDSNFCDVLRSSKHSYTTSIAVNCALGESAGSLKCNPSFTTKFV